MSKEYNILICSGGAVKAVAYVGVFKKLEELIDERKVLEQMKPYVTNKLINSVKMKNSKYLKIYTLNLLCY